MAGLVQVRTVPGLEEHFRNGFNARRGDFLGEPVFARFDLNGRTTDPWGAEGRMQEYSLPDHISFDGQFDEQKADLGHFLKTTEDYDKTFSIDVHAEGSYGAFSGSADSSYFSHEHLFTSSERAYTMDFLVAAVYFARRTRKRPELDREFKTALAALPAKLDADEALDAYRDFFDEYGTHYLVQAPFGGFTVMTSSVDKSEFAQSSETKIAASITAAFDGLVAKGSLTVSTAQAEMDATTRSEVSIEGDLHRVGGVASDDKSTWEASLYDLPAPLIGLPAGADVPRPQFASLSDLVADVDRRQTMKDALTAYLERPVGTFGQAQSVAFGSVEQATTDGFIVAYANAGGDGQSHVSVSAEDSESPTQVRAGADSQFSSGGGVWAQFSAATAPIRKGEYYVAEMSGAGGAASFIPLGDGRSLLGTAESAPAAGTAATDGLLVVDVTAPGDGPRGSAYGSVDGRRVAACSVHVWSDSGRVCRQASFCMPVRKGQAYQVELVPTWGTLDMSVTWIPLATIGFPEPIQTRELRRAYTAKANGILFGYMHCENGPRGTMRVKVGDDASAVGSAPVIQAASAHVWYDDDTHMPDAALAVPIAEDQTYIVEPEWTWGAPEAHLFWLRLG